ncbi:MAG TPA: hypothetical protein VIK30_13890, partial [Polyangia bacterium]
IRIWGDKAGQDRTKLDWLSGLRELDPDVWIRPLMNEIDRLAHTHIAIDDLRTPREWQELAARGFVYVRVQAPEESRIDRLKASGKFTTLEALTSPIQVALDAARYDYNVWNGEDVPALEEQLAAIINRERSKRA